MSPHFLLAPATFLLLLLLLSPPTTSADTTTVLDIDGHPLQASTNYYILPVVRGRGGGLTLLPKNDTAFCPLYVGQETLEVSKGYPLKFFPLNPEEKLISVSTDLNFEFDVATICLVPTGWSLISDDASGRLLIGIGGTRGNPGLETLSNWFKIEKAGSGKYDYKIVFCPGVCEFCRPICGDVGVFVEKDGKRLLGLSDQPLLVKFRKA